GLTRMCIDSGRPKKGRGLVKWRSNALHCFAAFCITCNPIRERPALEMKLEGGWDDNLFFLRPARRGHDMTNHAPEEADGEREREREETHFFVEKCYRVRIASTLGGRGGEREKEEEEGEEEGG